MSGYIARCGSEPDSSAFSFYGLYDFDHGLNETIRLRIPWARVLHLESVLQGKLCELLGHELGSLICVHRCWYPIF